MNNHEKKWLCDVADVYETQAIHLITYVNSQKTLLIVNVIRLIINLVFWYSQFFSFYRSFTNIIDQLSSKLWENLSAAMTLRRCWINTLVKKNKHAFWAVIDKIVVQLQENDKFTKTEVTAADSVKEQNLLWIQKIEMLKADAVMSKWTADVLTVQEEELHVIRCCLEMLTDYSALKSCCLSF